MHKFEHKFKFKGPWDATGKIVKRAIKSCESQFKRCANAMDCYENMTERLATDGNGKVQKQWKNGKQRRTNVFLPKHSLKQIAPLSVWRWKQNTNMMSLLDGEKTHCLY